MRFWASRGFGPVRLGISFGLPLRRGARRLFRQAGPGGFVYIVKREGDEERVKIGSSINPPQRLRSLQTGSADRLYIAWSTYVQADHVAVEHEAHGILDRHRGFNEWFAVPTDVAVAAISAASYRIGEAEVPNGYPRRTRLIQNAVMCGLPVLGLASFFMHVSAAEAPTEPSGSTLPLRGNLTTTVGHGDGPLYCQSLDEMRELLLASNKMDRDWASQLKTCAEIDPAVKVEEIETISKGPDFHVAKVRVFLPPASEVGYAILIDAK